VILRKVIKKMPPDLIFQSHDAPNLILTAALRLPQTPLEELTVLRRLFSGLIPVQLLREGSEKKRERKRKGGDDKGGYSTAVSLSASNNPYLLRKVR